MRRILKSLFRAWYLMAGAVVATVMSLASQAQEVGTVSAHAFAEQVKNELIAVIKTRDDVVSSQGSEKYYDAVERVLDPVVDFNYIARGVMGKFAKVASPEQQAKFTEIFRRSLVTTYANGMAGYVDHEIVVVPPKKAIGDARSVSVGLEVRSGDSVNRLSFSLMKRSDNWKLTNMILNGINFGLVLRSQFAQAMQKNNNNIDVVINSWSGA